MLCLPSSAAGRPLARGGLGERGRGPDVPEGSHVSLPELYISKPSITFPGVPVDNAETIRRVRAGFKGTDKEFAALASAIEKVFAMCKTERRYLETDHQGRVADYAVTAARQRRHS